MVKGVVTDNIEYLAADDEDRHVIAQANARIDLSGKFLDEKVLVRAGRGEVAYVDPTEVDYMDVSPKQMVSIATALIPFLEHDDANRALMGANMQRQAVPTLRPEAPYIGTGVEARAAHDAGELFVAEGDGVVTEVTGAAITVDVQPHRASRSPTGCRSSAARTRARASTRSRWSRPATRWSRATSSPTARRPTTVSSRSARTCSWRSCRGRVTTSRTRSSSPSGSCATTCSPRSTSRSTRSTPRDTKLGAEEITRDIPNLSEDILKDLDERGIIRIGAEVGPGDVLVGKVTPKGETELTPEERLLRAIFGEKAREVRDTSLKVPHGETGKVIDVRVFSRDDGDELPPGVNQLVRVYVGQKRKISEGDKLAGRHGNKGVISKILPVEDMPHLADGTPVDIVLNPLGVPSRMNVGQVLEAHLGYAARHGWEGQRVGAGQPAQDAPDHRARSVGQHAGVRRCALGRGRGGRCAGHDPEPVRHAEPRRCRRHASMVNTEGKATLYDGRTGEPYDSPVTVGYMYILKLSHLVDDKIHARSTGPYSMITQQPLGGKAQFGGQRFGEMEVWALEAYGASYALQEILTIKSDDVLGRVKVYEAIVKGENIPEPGIPESFKVLIKEMQALCLDVKVIDEEGAEIVIRELDEDAFRTTEALGIDLSRPERGTDEEDEARRNAQV